MAGPTCSGKSALALALAERLGGAIINADAMQCYRELRVITARPSPQDEARAPHALYGVLPAAEAGSAAWWRGQALEAMAQAQAQGRVPILCGGTGLYFLSLTEGLSAIPDPGEAARAAARLLLAELGPQALHRKLAAYDPETASRLNPADGQRIARAWEVWAGTGRPLAEWQRGKGPKAPWRFSAIHLDPPREALREAIASRFTQMLAQGAIEEVRAVLGHDPALPAMRAHGVPELAAYLRGEITLPEAARRAELATGQYTKRQATWFRHHKLAEPAATHTIHARYAHPTQFSESFTAQIIHFLQMPG